MKKICNISCFLAVLNLLVLFLFWSRFSAPVLAASSTFFPGSETHGAFLAAQANHYALLQLYMVLFSMALALVTFWGYTEIKKGAEVAASKAIGEVLPQLIQQRLEKLGPEQIARSLIHFKMENSSQKSSKDVFKDNIQQVFEGLED